MTDTYQVQTRTTTGKAVKKLRREGILPASIYGRGVESVAVQLPYLQARDMMNAHGTNSLVNLQVEGEATTRPVVVREVDQDPVSRKLWHVDFLQVDLTRKITGPVPLHFVDEAPAVKDLGGVLVHSLDSIEVEALPGDMPDSIEVSVASLTELESHLTVKDVVAPRGVTILADPDQFVVAVSRPRVMSDDDEAAVAEGEQPEEAAAASADADAPAAEAAEGSSD